MKMQRRGWCAAARRYWRKTTRDHLGGDKNDGDKPAKTKYPLT
jgi:hypothetical protein